MSIKYYTAEQIAEMVATTKEQVIIKDAQIAELNLKIQSLEETLEMYREDKLKDIPTLAELKALRDGK